MKKNIIFVFVLFFIICIYSYANEISSISNNTKQQDFHSNEPIRINPIYKLNYSPPKTASVIYFEDFESGTMPANYTIIDGNGDGFMWDVDTAWSFSSNPPNYGTYFAVYDDYAILNGDSTTEIMILPSIFIDSSYLSLYLSYSYSFQDYAGNGDTYVLIRSFSGSWSSWDTLIVYPFDIGGTDTFNLSAILPADSVQIMFDYYKANAATGWGAAVDNIKLISSLLQDDIELKSIIIPDSIILPGLINPVVEIYNNWNTGIYDYWVYVLISDTFNNTVYMDSIFITDTISPLTSDTIQFSEFDAQYLYDYILDAWISYAPDTFYFNDSLSMHFRTYNIDAQCVSILSPIGYFNTLISGDFYNNGSQTIDFYAYYILQDLINDSIVLIDSQYVSVLEPGNTIQVDFSIITASIPSSIYELKLFSNVNHDINRSNDTLIDTLIAFKKWENLASYTSDYPAQWATRCIDAQGKLWVIGGTSSNSTVQTYDTINGWQKITDLPSPMNSGAAAVINNKLYVIGGFDDGWTPVPLTQIYDILTDTWSTGAITPPDPRGGVAGGVYNDKIYIIGGSTGPVFPTDCPTYSYNPSADTINGTPWDTLTPCPRELSSDGIILGTPFYGTPGYDHIFVGGDYQGTKDMYKYTPSADTAGGSPWDSIGDILTYGGTKDVSVVWDNDYAYFIGGDVDGSWSGVYSDMTIIYDINNNAWIYGKKILNTGVEGNACGIIGEYIYAFGGTIGFGAVSPPPFERVNINDLHSSIIEPPHLTYSNPPDGAIGIDHIAPIILGFDDIIDTTRNFTYSLDPNPGLILNIWTDNLETLYIYHDSLEMDRKYYLSIIEAYNKLGYQIEETPTYPLNISFATGVTGINNTLQKKLSFNLNNSIVNNIIKMNYTLPVNGDVSISIYNMNGSRIANKNYTNQKAGSYSLKLSLNLPSGKYVSKFKFNDKEITKSFILIK